MKKTIGLLIGVMIMMSLTGCVNKPEKCVDNFCDALRDFDWDRAFSYGVYTQEAVSGIDKNNPFSKLMKQWLSDLSWTVKETKAEGDKTTVTVDFNYPDASEVIASYLENGEDGLRR